VFFWASFEQAGGSMTILQKNLRKESYFGNSASLFKIADALLTIIPLIIITYVLIKLFKQTSKKVCSRESYFVF
jgi:POT family proton-dependent oligopeptide transporter